MFRNQENIERGRGIVSALAYRVSQCFFVKRFIFVLARYPAAAIEIAATTRSQFSASRTGKSSLATRPRNGP
jgi:hypothetical protein